jgi:hypothetical protein
MFWVIYRKYQYKEPLKMCSNIKLDDNFYLYSNKITTSSYEGYNNLFCSQNKLKPKQIVKIKNSPRKRTNDWMHELK